MTEITMYHINGRWNGFEMKGHADYAKPGKDIVCAGLSSMAQLVILQMERNVILDKQIKPGHVFALLKTINIHNMNKIYDILGPFYVALLDLEKQYPDNVRVKLQWRG